MTQTDPNYFDMPDDQVMGMSAPAASQKTPEELEAERLAAEQAEQAARVQAEADAAAAAAAAATAGGGEGGGDPVVAGTDPLAAADDAIPFSAAAKPAEVKDPAAAQPAAGNPATDPAKAAADPNAPDPSKNADGTPKADPAQPGEPDKVPTPEDYKAFYDRILGQPIKANGKHIQLRSVDEAEQLIQMGLNYTKKMQAWQPRMRVVTMLENNGLLDEAKLAHLIDLSKGDPLAIQKLLADSKFDPMTVDADKAASYKPGNHQVSDAEMAFNAALDDLESTDTGVELITEVAKQWDEQSRQAAYRDPSILRVINEQKALGLYARITSEMERLKLLGHLQGVPFLQAYRAVGDMLHERGQLVPEPQRQPDPTPVETRVAAPAPKVTNNEKAAAASPTKATPAAPKVEPNFLDLPDDQFLKQMQGRL